jgi:hypothetical protein
VSKKRIFCTLVYLVPLCVMLIVAVVIASVLGVSHMLDVVGDVPESVATAANTAYSVTLSSRSAFVDLSSVALSPALSEVNRTVCDSIDFTAFRADLLALDALRLSIPGSVSLVDNITICGMEFTALSGEYNTTLAPLYVVVDYIQNVGTYINTSRRALVEEVNQSVYMLQYNILDTLGALTYNVSYLDSVFEQQQIGFVNSTDAAEMTGDVVYDRGFITGVQKSLLSVQTGLPLHHKFAAASGSGSSNNTISVSVSSSESASVNGTMERLLQGRYNAGNTSELIALAGQLHRIYEVVASLPNYTTAAEQLVSVRLYLATVEKRAVGLLDVVLATYKSHERSLANVSVSYDRFERQWRGAQNATAAAIVQSHVLNTSNLITLNNALMALSNSVGVVLTQVEQMRAALEGMSPILYDIVKVQTVQFDAKIMKLPDVVSSSYLEAISLLNESVHQLSAAELPLEEQSVLVAQLLQNVFRYRGVVDNLIRFLNEAARNVLNGTEYKGFVNNMTSLLGPRLNSTRTEVSVSTVRNAFESVNISDSIVSGLRKLEHQKSNLLDYLYIAARIPENSTASTEAMISGERVALFGDYWLLSHGNCAHNSSTYCGYSTPGCNCTEVGMYRCSVSTTHENTSFMPCTLDENCTAFGAYCLADKSRGLALQQLLDKFAAENSSLRNFGQDDLFDALDTARDAVDSADFNNTGTVYIQCYF